jgi:hypothetical protein
MDRLLALQKLQFDARGPIIPPQAELEKVRAEVPPPILAHYERLVARGKKGVALALNGVCSECHLRITSGKLVDLSAGSEVQLCDNCGRYLYLPVAASPGSAETKILPATPLKRTQGKAAPYVA